jgi:riboflavin kinase/FMN adenylyltransferase
VREYLYKRCGVRQLVIGPDARIGRNREGDAEFIARTGESLGLSVHIVEWEEQDGQRISSSLIRRYLLEGEVELVNQQLGRPFSIFAKVVHGQAVVYAGSVTLGEASYPAVCNVGTRPTFSGDNEVRAEVHIIDYKGPELYGQRIEFSFLSRVRDERRFSSLDELTGQISKDVERGREIYGKR